jgi:glucose/arabinose dehydrogenase
MRPWHSSVAICAAAIAVGVLTPAPVRAQATLPDGFSDQLVVGGLDFPVGMAKLADGRVFVIEQKTAKIRLIVNGELSSTDPVCVVDQVQTSGLEQGLLGIATDPGWPARPYVYVHCDETAPNYTIRISRYTVTGDLSFTGNGALSIDVATRRDLINQLPDLYPIHNGGTLRFGPDGRLYDSMGEDSQGCLAQDDSTLHGVILRLDVSRLPATPGGPPSMDVITPPDNPQIGATEEKTRITWAWGLRNPFRFAIDPSGVLFIGDVGENTYEEVDRAPVGGLNFGWPHFEAFAVNNGGCDTSSATTRPIAFYDRTSFPSGAAVMCAGAYHAPAGAATPFPPGYDGDVFFSDFYQGFLRRLKGSGNNWSLAPAVSGQPNANDWAEGMDNVSDYFVARDGSLWYCRGSNNFAGGTGAIRRIVPQSSGPTPSPSPALDLLPPYPQPANGPVNLPFRISVDGTVNIDVYALDGSLVRSLMHNVQQPAGGTILLTWDGIDDHGHAVRGGIYLVKISALGFDRSCRVVMLR